MAITNWAAGAAGGAHESDTERRKIALQAQAQENAQKRWEAEFEERKREREDAKQWREKTYADQRNDVNYNRDFEREKFDTQRGDVNYNRGFEREKFNAQRGDVDYNRGFEREKYDNKLYQDAFDNELKLDKHNQATALFDNQMAEYNRITADREAKQQASKTSLAALLAYGIRNGDRDEQGRIFIPTDAMNMFNASLSNAMGANRAEYMGAVLITKNPDGTPLNGMQVALLKKDGGVNVIPQNELAGLVDTFPGLKGEYDGLMGQLFPQQQKKPKFDNNTYKYLNDLIHESDNKIKALRSDKDLENNPKNPTAISHLETERGVYSAMRDIFMETNQLVPYDVALIEYQRRNREKLGLDEPVEERTAVDDELDLN